MFLIEPLAFFIKNNIFFGLMCGFFLFFTISFAKNREMLSGICGVFTLIGTGTGFSWFLLNSFTAYNKKTDLYLWIIAVVIGFIVAIAIERKYLFSLDKIIEKLTRKSSLERNKKTDVRSISDFLPTSSEPYDPSQFYKKGSFFIGLDESNKPVYHHGDLPHIQVVGMTGSGKGVFLGSLANQCTIADEAVFFIDPKDDEWLPHVLKHGADLANKRYFFINLSEKVYQFNIFDGVDAEELEELLIAGFGLDETGRESDYFKLFDRKATQFLASQYETGETAAGLLKKHRQQLESIGTTAKEPSKTENFVSKLEELANVHSVNAKNPAFTLSSIVENGGVVMIVGSMKRPKIKRIQKMLLVRLLQLAEKRDRIAASHRKIAVFLDEAKYHISPVFLEAFGAARDKGLHVIVAHQSSADFEDTDSGLNGDAVFNKIFDNSKIKLIYKVEFPETAEIFARKSGKIQVDDEMRMLEKSLSLVEKNSDKRTIRQSERYLIDENMILNLPSRCGVAFGINELPAFVYTSPIIVNKTYTAISPTENEQKHDDDVIDLEQL
jgi:type IV secretory pathway TraG/TraD family ATPase VirD4